VVRQLVTVAPVTTRIRAISTELELGAEDGLPKRRVVNLDTITTIPKGTLTEQISPLTPAKLLAVDRALTFALGLRN
jgi:mRNA interferase MazF